jgi:hypothetical protein
MSEEPKFLYALIDGKIWISSRFMTEAEAAEENKKSAEQTEGILFWQKSQREDEYENKPIPMDEAKLPSRVVYDFHGNARKPEQTDRIDIAFQRQDGWTIGAPEPLERITYHLWKGHWTHFHRPGDLEWRPIEEYEKA